MMQWPILGLCVMMCEDNMYNRYLVQYLSSYMFYMFIIVII